MNRKHRFVIRYCEWSREYRAYSDSIGPENSPEGVAESPVEALELLIDELEELEKRSTP
jgi:hypothetical protein